MSSKHGCRGSSPSSGGAESAIGSPETLLTPFSSVNYIGEKRPYIFKPLTGHSIDIKASQPHLALKSVDKDPFISDGVKNRSEQSLLSPTASAFQPFALRIAQGMIHNSIMLKDLGTSVCGRSTKKPGHDVASSGTDLASPAGHLCPASSYSGKFSTDVGSPTRALKISEIYQPVQVALVQAYVQNSCIRATGSQKIFHFGGDVLMRFSNIMDAINAYNILKATHPEWAVDFIAPDTFAEKMNPRSPYVSAHEGQVGVTATFSVVSFDRVKLEEIVLDLLAVDGAIYAHRKQMATEVGTVHLIAEYNDVNAAACAIDRLNGAIINGCKISIDFYKPDMVASLLHRCLPCTPTRGGMDPAELMSSFNRISISGPALLSSSMDPARYSSVLSPTGRSLIPSSHSISPGYSHLPAAFGGPFSPTSGAIMSYSPLSSQHNSTYIPGGLGTRESVHHGFGAQIGGWDAIGSPSRAQSRGDSLPRFGGKRQHPAREGVRSSYVNNQIGQHNVVDIDRIRAGLDVRTTIMLRNIPNKIDQGLLKAIVDQTSRGLYDFMYLRIDFANNCNVGYAFINFEDPYHIIGFVAARAGQRWNRYSSDKIAEVSYATIQGKDCLVQKFRNSSVMLEHPSFRPKIFFTGNESRAGEEEDFPLPDNASKMRRSVENAEHVGLFAPRAGQHYRDEQRRRRSRYDRGTRLAALEEFDYEDYYTVEEDLHGSYIH